MTLWSRGLARSHDKLKLLYLHYHSAHDHQTWKNSDLPWGAPNHKVIYCLVRMVLQGHVTNENHYISSTRVPMATKLSRMIIYLDGFLSIKSFDPLISWPSEITWQNKNIKRISPMLQCLWPPNLVGWWFTSRSYQYSYYLTL